MPRPGTPEETQDLIERGVIPLGATPAIASGTPSELSLSDEYLPSPDREKAFMRELGNIALREAETEADISDVRLQ